MPFKMAADGVKGPNLCLAWMGKNSAITISIIIILLFMMLGSDRTIFSEKIFQISPCQGRYVHMYDLPADFNDLLVEKNCAEVKWICESIRNNGTGDKFEDAAYEKLVPKEAWFKTDQYALEILFRERMKMYECLTDDPEVANLFYIPFYPGLDLLPIIFSHTQMKDKLSQRLIGWLQSKPYFTRKQGRDHLLIMGRIAWDFSRGEDSENWGTSLLNLKELQNVTKAGIERNTWGGDSQLGVPYPTGFHPSTPKEMQLWKDRIKNYDKNTLVSYCGAPRHSVDGWSVPRLRNILIGDSPTRKAIFDSILAGCIPVLFSPDSAYNQYLWHLPKNFSSYSVFIPQERLLNSSAPPFDVVGFLDSIPDNVVDDMRQNIVDIVPRIVYSGPGYHSSDPALHDAFHITVEHAIRRSIQ